MSSASKLWPNGARARSAILVPTERHRNVCKYPVDVYKNYDGSWFAAHFHGGRHMGLKHPVQPEEVQFTDDQ